MVEQQIKKWGKKHYITAGVVVIGIIGIIIYFLIQKNNYMTQNSEYKKVLVIGIDGMDPRIIQSLMDDDKMPNFKQLSEDGTGVELQTVFPPQSPVAWTTIATGVNAGKHNIFDFIRRNPETYLPMLGLFESESSLHSGTRYSSLVTVDPFWKKLGANDIFSIVVKWPMTFPSENFNGRSLAGLGTPDVKGFLSGYTLYTESDFDSEKDSNKVEKVKFDNGKIDTIVYGPKSKQGGEIKDITAPMQIEKKDDNTIKIVNGDVEAQIAVGEWTQWMKSSFSVNFFTKESGIWRAYLESVEPFQMFVTTMQIDPEHPITEISYPHNYSSDLAKDIGLYYTLGMPEETDGLMDGALSEDGFMKHLAQIEGERDQMFWKEFDEFQLKDSGVLAFVYDSSDRLQHTHWIDTILAEDSTEKIEYDDAIAQYYIDKDHLLGEVLRKVDNDTAVIVLSDHGFTSFERGLNVNTWLKDNDFMTLTQEVTDEDDGSLFEYVDWHDTKAYAVGFNAIYINQKGREGSGIVENKDEIMDEIIQKLENIVDEKTGKKVIYKAYKASEIWHGDAFINAPDIVLGYYPGYRTDWKTAIGGFTVEAITDNEKKWTGDHMVDKKFVPGVFYSNFPIQKQIIEQVDIVPTIYNILNIDPSDEFDGQNLL